MSINEYFLEPHIPPALMDALWGQGWRHFGAYFFRYSKAGQNDVLPLRLQLGRFQFSTSQRRVLKRNQDLEVAFQPAFINAEIENLFERHKVRFSRNIPDSLFTFIDEEPAKVPCDCLSLTLHHEGQLIGMSYLDIGQTASSSVYQFFDPAHSKRSLGVLMILLSIENSLKLGQRLYYPGYAYRQPSEYDYKKRLGRLEYFDWQGNWLHLSP